MDYDITSYNALRLARKVKSVQEAAGSTATVSSAWVTLVSMSGAGFLYLIRMGWNPSATAVTFRVTIDGGTPKTFAAGQAVPYYSHLAVPYMVMPLNGVAFASTILVEFQQSSATSYVGDAHIVWGSK